MGRPKEFNRDAALEKAMMLFWDRGFEATSVQDLVDAMGINRGSLYDTFGDKHSLFLEALEKYHAELMSRMLLSLNEKDAGLPEIKSFFSGIVERVKRGEAAIGCFAGNSLVERASSCCDSADCVKKCLDSIESALKNALRGAKKTGEVSKSLSVDDTAKFLMVTAIGFNSYGKLDLTESEMKKLVTTALKVLN